MMFRKETEFQETEIGKLPEGWRIKRLGEVAIIRSGFSERRRDERSRVIHLRPDNINNETDKIIFNDIVYIPESSKIEKYLLEHLDIVLVNTNGSINHIGKVGIIDFSLDKKITFSNHLTAIRIASKDINPYYVYYFLSLLHLKGYYKKLVKNQAGKWNLNLSTIRDLLIPIPPLEEQKRIADILSMIDSGIEAVDRAIAKLEGMKRALLNELLTGRIRVREENGRLTFYKETEFQETEIGEMPKDWYVKRLKEVADFQRGFSYRSDEKFAEEIPDGYLFLTLNSVKEGGGLKENGWTWIKSNKIKDRHFVREGDLVIANTEQSKDGSLIGSPAIVHFPKWYKKDKAVFSHHISRLLLKINNIDVNFLFYYLSFVQPLARKYHTGTGVWGLDVDKWGTDLLIPLSPIKEQTAIAEILSTVDKAIEPYRKEEEKLLRLRRGLMSVLLTGRVRVVSDVRDVGVVV